MHRYQRLIATVVLVGMVVVSVPFVLEIVADETLTKVAFAVFVAVTAIAAWVWLVARRRS